MTTRTTKAILTTLALAIPLAGATGDEKQRPAAQKPVPAFEALRALAGDWEGTARPGGAEKGIPSRATIRVVSNGSAVMLVTDPGTPHEMVTMFHRDEDALVATHYCAAMNQPRMKATATADARRVSFDFLDGTNLVAYPGRMQGLVVAMPSPDRHTQAWTYRGNGKESTMLFDLSRKK